MLICCIGSAALRFWSWILTKVPSVSTISGSLLSSLTIAVRPPDNFTRIVETNACCCAFLLHVVGSWDLACTRRGSTSALLWTRPVWWAIEKSNSCESRIHRAKRPLASTLCSQRKARFPQGEFVRATRSKNKNPATWLVKIGWLKNSPRTSRKRSYFFVCSREQIRLVENGLKACGLHSLHKVT